MRAAVTLVCIGALEAIGKGTRASTIHWNAGRLREMMEAPIAECETGLWDAFRSFRDRFRGDPGSLDSVEWYVTGFLDHYYFADSTYGRIVTLLKAIFVRMAEMADSGGSDRRIESHLLMIANAGNSCYDSQINTLQTIHCLISPLRYNTGDSIGNFVGRRMAFFKRYFFELAAASVENREDPHWLNHLRHALGSEVGVDPGTGLSYVNPPEKHRLENALDKFYRGLTPEWAVERLRYEMNKINEGASDGERTNGRQKMLSELGTFVLERMPGDRDEAERYVNERLVFGSDEGRMALDYCGVRGKAVEDWLVHRGILATGESVTKKMPADVNKVCCCCC